MASNSAFHVLTGQQSLAASTTATAPSNSPNQDAVLLTRVRQGDQAAMAGLYDAHCKVVYSVALRLLHEESAAEDVLHEVFLRIWRNPESFVAARGNLAAWLAIIARNQAIDVLRQRKPVKPLEDARLPTPNISRTADKEASW